MYRGFKLPGLDIPNQDIYISEFKHNLELQRSQVRKSLEAFVYNTNTLDGTKIQSAWFPQLEADVFISHSHSDENKAVALAGWLLKHFGIKSFIDSTVWGYSAELLKEIDNIYCQNDDGHSYDYHKRNFSTSHVHMMLATALGLMIDRTECIFFLDTPNSIVPTESIQRTLSPWIYYEITVTKFVKKSIPERLLRHETKLLSEREFFEKSLAASYQIDLEHLSELNIETLNKWSEKKTKAAASALNLLYQLVPPNASSNFIYS